MKRTPQKKINEEKEMEGATFKPQTFTQNHGSKTARQRELRPEEMLQFQGQLAQDRKRKLKEDYDRKEMEGVTFQPSLCKRSE